ncbi:MAG: DUF2007 domain-containing protein [Velocimicrobium sp.]
MYCPNCKQTYVDGITTCTDCGEPLIEIPDKEVAYEEVTAMDAVKLISVDNTINAELVLNLLRNNDIPCYAKDNGIGGYMNIYMGYSIFGKEIYVDKSDFAHATEVLAILETNEDDITLEEEPYDSQSSSTPSNRLSARLILFFWIAVILLFAILNKNF